MVSELVANFVTQKIYPALLVVFFFGLTIFIHELGHFWMARRRGMKVERFSIGFGPKIFGWKKDGIDYRVSWLPFGGYVALPQMSPMEAIEGKNESVATDLPPASPWSKILVALAGPVMNILLAILLATIIWQVGKPVNPSIIGSVDPGSPEEQAGLLPGDRIVAVNSVPVATWGQLMENVAFSRESDVVLHVQRQKQALEFRVPVTVNPQFKVKMLNLLSRERPYARNVLSESPAEKAGILNGDRFISVEGVPVHSSGKLRELIGIRTNQLTQVKIARGEQLLELTVVPVFNPGEKAARMGVELGDDLEVVRPGPTPVEQFEEVLHSMWGMATALFHHKETGIGIKNVSGPVGISYAWWYAIVDGGIMAGMVIAVLLNINLAILNLLPLPVLDGGHIVFALIEAAWRRPLNAKFVQNLSVGFAMLLISFMMYVSWNDISPFFRRSKIVSQETVPAVPPTPAPAAP